MLISLQDIGVSFAGTTILEHITADVQEDSRIGLIGPNGAGKSTLLNMITGELENEWGEIYRKPMLGVGYLHQNSGLTGENTIRREMRSVFQKVLDLLYRHSITTPYFARMAMISSVRTFFS